MVYNPVVLTTGGVEVRAAMLVTILIGTAVLLYTYLDTPSPRQRGKSRYLLAAYLLTACSLTLPLGDVITGSASLPGVDGGTPNPWLAALWVLILTVPLSLLSSRVRAIAKGSPMRPASHDAFVLAAAAYGLLTPYAGVPQVIEYMLVRPILLAHGFLLYQIVDVDAARLRAVLAASGAGALVSLLIVLPRFLQEAGLDMASAVSLSFLAAAALALAFGPALRGLVGNLDGEISPAWRREVYLAALEETIQAERSPDPTGNRVLRALREHLKVSEREHASLDLLARRGLARASAQIAPGRVFLGKYEVERELGEGGFGRTFLAWDAQVHRRVVLKAARAQDAAEAERLLREARVLAKLNDPHIVTVHDVETIPGECFLVLEHMEGGSLAQRLQHGPLSAPEALAVADDVLAALETAHAAGVVHRDVKPANVLFTRAGLAKLCDFGIAKDAPSAEAATGRVESDPHAGTWRYMAPEQIRGLRADHRADLYSAAIVLYECLAGRPYLDFKGLTGFEAALLVLDNEPPRSRGCWRA